MVRVCDGCNGIYRELTQVEIDFLNTIQRTYRLL